MMEIYMKNAIHDTISATDLVRQFSAIIDKVRISGRSLYITKGRQTIAELSPPRKSGFPIKNLAHFLNDLPSLGDDAKALSQDIKSIKNKAQIPENPWD
jgi:antitoxin (DNA-binding transcriptional repressor) of toxin-antitoxin stability system